ncbi:MAG: FHA domain-containing protein [Chloroflexota bacterium]
MNIDTLRTHLKAQLKDSHRPLYLNIFEEQKEVLARSTLTIKDLITETLKNVKDLNEDGNYAFYYGPVPKMGINTDQAIDPATQIHELVSDVLRFGYFHEDNGAVASLIETSTGREFVLDRFPAVLGRRKPNQTDDDLMVDVASESDAIVNAGYVSGRHAIITYRDGRYYIEQLNDHNPVWVDGQKITFGEPKDLRNNSSVRLGGKIYVEFTFVLDAGVR